MSLKDQPQLLRPPPLTDEEKAVLLPIVEALAKRMAQQDHEDEQAEGKSAA